MRHSMFAGLVLAAVVLFASLPAPAGTSVYYNANDHFIRNGYLLALPDTPVIVNGVIYGNGALIPESDVYKALPYSNVLTQFTPPPPGSRYVIVDGIVYDISPSTGQPPGR